MERGGYAARLHPGTNSFVSCFTPVRRPDRTTRAPAADAKGSYGHLRISPILTLGRACRLVPRPRCHMICLISVATSLQL